MHFIQRGEFRWALLILLTGSGAGWLWVSRPRVEALPVAPLGYDGGGFVIGDLRMTFGQTDNLRSGLRLAKDPSGRVVLCEGGRSFVLGPLTSAADPSGRPEFSFAAELGDQVSLTRSRTLFAWPPPFKWNILGPQRPRWIRPVDYRLVWKKPSGARLEIIWRYEQEYYSGKGWTDPSMLWNSRTGLVSVAILSA